MGQSREYVTTGPALALMVGRATTVARTLVVQTRTARATVCAAKRHTFVFVNLVGTAFFVRRRNVQLVRRAMVLSNAQSMVPATEVHACAIVCLKMTAGSAMRASSPRVLVKQPRALTALDTANAPWMMSHQNFNVDVKQDIMVMTAA